MSSNTTTTDKPTVTEKLQAAFSSKTADEIHQENLMKKSGDNTTTSTSGSTLGSSSGHHTTSSNQPTIGEHIKGAMSYKTAQQIHDENQGRPLGANQGMAMSSGPVIHPDTASNTRSTTYGSTATTGSHLSSGTQMSGGTMGTAQTTRTEMNVKSVAADAMRQIDAQAQDALAKAEALRRQDEARLTQSSTGAYTQLDAQAEQLKQKIEAEKLAAQEEINRQQAAKLERTRERSEMEKRAIHEAAMRRKAELEAKSNKLQSEIEELTRLKTQEMMAEQPGDLQVTHVSEDTGVVAKLTGAVAHKLGIQKDTHVTQTITEGHVQHQPVQVTKQYQASGADAQTHTRDLGTTHESYTLPTKSATGGMNTTTTGIRQTELADSKRNI